MSNEQEKPQAEYPRYWGIWWFDDETRQNGGWMVGTDNKVYHFPSLAVAQAQRRRSMRTGAYMEVREFKEENADIANL